jgi:cell wall assembly regulator SMI1
MKAIFDRFHHWLAANAPAVLASLRPGATEQAVRAAEADLGLRLPADVKACYRIHDGQDLTIDAVSAPGFLYGCEWLTLAQICEDRRYLVEFAARVAADDEINEPAGPIAREWYHPAWVPVTNNRNDDRYCLDLAPEPGGDIGQIILWYPDWEAAERLVRARRFAAWLGRFADQLEQRRWTYSEEDAALTDD